MPVCLEEEPSKRSEVPAPQGEEPVFALPWMAPRFSALVPMSPRRLSFSEASVSQSKPSFAREPTRVDHVVLSVSHSRSHERLRFVLRQVGESRKMGEAEKRGEVQMLWGL